MKKYIEDVLIDTVRDRDSVFSIERALSQDEDFGEFGLTGHDKREVEGKQTEVFVYNYKESNSSNEFYLYRENDDIKAHVPRKEDPVI